MTEIDAYLKQTRRCLDTKLYYPAFAMALARPDICASPAGIGGGKRYRYHGWPAATRTYRAVHRE